MAGKLLLVVVAVAGGVYAVDRSSSNHNTGLLFVHLTNNLCIKLLSVTPYYTQLVSHSGRKPPVIDAY